MYGAIFQQRKEYSLLTYSICILVTHKLVLPDMSVLRVCYTVSYCILQ